MAAKQSAVKSLDLIEDEVTCLICKGIYCDPDLGNVPKKLPCDHIICLQCLQRLILRSVDGTLKCPTCRATSPIGEFDATQFPTAHQVNRFIDIYHKTLEEQAQKSSVSDESPQYLSCLLHSPQPLALYCETCQKTVCRDCVILSCASEKHNYGFLKELAKEYESELEEKTKPLREFQQQISASVSKVVAANDKLEEQKKEELEKIEAVFEIIFHKIAEQKKEIVSETLSRYKSQSVQNALKVKELRSGLESLMTAIETTENLDIVHNMTTNRSILLSQKQQLEQLHLQIEALLGQPNYVCELDKKLECSPQLFNPASFLFYLGKNFKCCLNEYNLLKSLKLKQPFQIDFQLAEQLNEARIKSKLICVKGKSSVAVSVTKIPTTNTIRLSVTPQARGQHELHILLSDSNICGSPIPVFVYCEPHQLHTLGKPKLIHLEAAAAIKCYGDNIMISSIPSTLNTLEYRQQKLTVTKKLQCRGINEFAIHNNYVYYSDILNHRLVRADTKGHISTGEKGSQLGQFKFPNGIRIHNDQIFVCDSDNGRIQVFDTELNFLRIIGEKGDGPGQFKQLNDLVFDEEGNMYVVEYLNHRVQVLTLQGDHIRFIGTATAGRFHLKNPVSLAIFNGHIYVTNTGRKCISVYTLSGTHVTSFGEGDDINPECIDIDSNGFIYVTSNRKNVVRY